LNSLLNVFLIRVMLWLLAFSCFFATLNYLFFISSFRGTPYSSGIYLYNINAVSTDGKQKFQATKKMLLIK